MVVDKYDIDVLVTGYPGKSVCHGGLGWSSIALIRGYGRVALVDVGSFGMRPLIIDRLAQNGLKPDDVTDVLLTHSHYDHSVNWTLFRQANIVIGAAELSWSVKEPWGETPVPELYVEKLESWPRLRKINPGDEVMPGITTELAPGHTPGHLVYLLKGSERDVIFVGDAAKNRAELLTRASDMTYDPDVSSRSFDMIWDLWRSKPGNIVIPGHDLPMILENGNISYIGKREAAIRAWMDDKLESTTLIELCV